MSSATIKIFLLKGDAKRIRTAEISNWNGKAIAAPRMEIDELLAREEAKKSGVYILFGADQKNNDPLAYVGEAEDIGTRLRAHKDKEFWVQAIAFVSKDENLTKSHIRYLEGRIIEEAMKIGRYKLDNSQLSGAKLPESDREDMENFLEKIRQLLPVLGTDILTPIQAISGNENEQLMLFCRIKGLTARGSLTPSGFAVYEGSQAVAEDRPSAKARRFFTVSIRNKLKEEGILIAEKDHLVFSRDHEFSSPSTAAAVVCGGAENGWIRWSNAEGRTLREIEKGKEE